MVSPRKTPFSEGMADPFATGIDAIKARMSRPFSHTAGSIQMTES
jgi:hypothetical protein